MDTGEKCTILASGILEREVGAYPGRQHREESGHDRFWVWEQLVGCGPGGRVGAAPKEGGSLHAGSAGAFYRLFLAQPLEIGTVFPNPGIQELK